ncbi:Mycosin-4 [Dissostichus eleginoides]|uniref:Mycosin-4 n=1 Tax=Dissostichus eleginoides TaxID=100907 RepID=A0AAD9C9V5_DISEL|nr:Mycosin-4 [Dissostichus eleginoides]
MLEQERAGVVNNGDPEDPGLQTHFDVCQRLPRALWDQALVTAMRWWGAEESRGRGRCWRMGGLAELNQARDLRRGAKRRRKRRKKRQRQQQV